LANARKRDRESILDLISLGVFLIVVGYVWSQHVNLPSRILSFLRSMGTYKGLPPYSSYPDIYDSFILVTYMLGAWSFILAVIKIPLGAGVSSALGSAFGGIFLFALGFFAGEYIEGRFTATTVLAYVFILGGLMVIAGALVNEATRHRGPKT